MQTEKMIYPEKTMADQIASLLAEANGGKYHVSKVTTGYQVIPVTVVKEYMPPKVPLPVQKPVIMHVGTTEAPVKSPAPYEFAAGDKAVEMEVFSFIYINDRPKNLIVTSATDGSQVWLHKSNIVGWALADGAHFSGKSVVNVKFPKGVAQKKNYVPHSIQAFNAAQ